MRGRRRQLRQLDAACTGHADADTQPDSNAHPDTHSDTDAGVLLGGYRLPERHQLNAIRDARI
jgi:hypothetical protein